MPEKITLEDGSEREVLTEEEVKVLNEKASQVEELTTKVSELTAKNEELSSSDENKNWSKLRTKAESLQKALEKQGIKTDDDGNVIQQPSSLTEEEIQERINKTAREVINSNYKSSLFKKYQDDAEKKELVEHYFNKLSAGEELQPETMDKIFTEAERFAFPEQKENHSVSLPGGNPPLIKTDDKNNFSNTEQGQSIANELFGEESFAKADNK